jgi:hypothetical protein
MDVENGEALQPEDIADIHREADTDIRSKMKLTVNTRLVLLLKSIYTYYIIILNSYLKKLEIKKEISKIS